MSHWRDGGIGNMSGSDDRPIEEWTLLEKLAEIATTPIGRPMPKCIGMPPAVEWATPLKTIAQAAFDEIVRLRDLKVEGLELRAKVAEDMLSTTRAHLGETQAECESLKFKLDLAERDIGRLLAEKSQNGGAA